MDSQGHALEKPGAVRGKDHTRRCDGLGWIAPSSWTNTFCNLDKYILELKQIYLKTTRIAAMDWDGLDQSELTCT